MVYRGKPSRACQRCRDRRLKCDLKTPSCSSCLRVSVPCTGYRDTKQLRIQNETQDISVKVNSKRLMTAIPKYLAYSMDVSARDMFFSYYVTEFSRTWGFLKPFYHTSEAPTYLSLTIDAVSLGFLSHQLYADRAMVEARRKYVVALRETHLALQRPEIAETDMALEASLLLDMFEKMAVVGKTPNDSYPVHARGALALVKTRGIERFRDESSLRPLMRFITNFIITCVSTDAQIPEEFVIIRNYVGKYFHIDEPKWNMSGLMIEYTELRYKMRNGLFKSNQDCVHHYTQLDKKFTSLQATIPSSWQYTTTAFDKQSQRKEAYYNVYHNYPNRTLTQTWNALRCVRIILMETIIELCSAIVVDVPDLCTEYSKPSALARSTIERLIDEICASVPQMTDCDGVARSKYLASLPGQPAPSEARHYHTPGHYLDCYVLIFPLYVVTWAKACPPMARSWAIDQLHHVGDHFAICNSSLVAGLAEQGSTAHPWTVYAMLGSYAFVA